MTGVQTCALPILALQRAQLQWAELDCHIAWCDERILAHVRSDEQAKVATQLCGIGPVTASAVVATVGDFKQFKTGAQFSSWLGVVPSQNSSGGKSRLGGITKRGGINQQGLTRLRRQLSAQSSHHSSVGPRVRALHGTCISFVTATNDRLTNPQQHCR